MKITEIRGCCLCDHVRFRVAGEVIFPHYYSCRQSRRWTGAPVVAWGGFPSRSLEWEGSGGAPTLFRSSPGTQHAFFSPLRQHPRRDRRWLGDVSFTIATLDDPDQFAPQAYNLKVKVPSRRRDERRPERTTQ